METTELSVFPCLRPEFISVHRFVNCSSSDAANLMSSSFIGLEVFLHIVIRMVTGVSPLLLDMVVSSFGPCDAVCILHQRINALG